MKFAELHAGQVFEIGERVVSEEEIVEYARRYDPQPFHTDKEAAQRSRWRGLIASGFHTCSLAMRMMVDHVLKDSDSIGSPGLEFVKWPNPVRSGDRLFLRVQVLESSRSRTGRVGAIRWEWRMENQSGKVLLDLIATSLFSISC